MAKIGLKNLYYAVITVGTNDTETYGTPVKIGEAVSVDVNPTTETATLYGDDMAVATDTQMREVSVTIETTDLSLSAQAALLGHTYDETKKELSAKGDDEAPYVGIAFESKMHNGKIRCVKLMKGKFSPTQETTNTKGEQLQYQVPSLTGTFVVDTSGVWKKVKEFDKGADTSTWYSTF